VQGVTQAGRLLQRTPKEREVRRPAPDETRLVAAFAPARMAATLETSPLATGQVAPYTSSGRWRHSAALTRVTLAGRTQYLVVERENWGVVVAGGVRGKRWVNPESARGRLHASAARLKVQGHAGTMRRCRCCCCCGWCWCWC
jgi:hypothetical protein